MTEWHEVTLGDALRVRHGFAFKGEYFRDDGNLIVLTPGNFIDAGGFKPKGGSEKFYDGPVPKGYLLEKGDVVVAMTEQSAGLLGSSATIPVSGRFLHNQRLGLLQVTAPEMLHRRFAYHVMNTPVVRQQIQATATGAKVRHTAPERIQAVRVELPSLRTQRVIAGILDAMDGLIDNYRRRVEVLEEMARAIYREWFVRLRFPGHENVALNDSAIGQIPSGWTVAPLKDIADIIMGQSPRSEFYNDEGIGKPFHQGVSDFGLHFPTTRKWCSADGRSAKAGDVLLSVRAPVGRINIADTSITIGRGLSAISARDGRQGLLLAQLREAFAEEDAMGNDGAIFKSLGKAELAAVNVVVATSDVADAANAILTDNLALIHAVSQSGRQLVVLRNLLLPKLVTGQIDVSSLDLGALVEDAVA